MNFLNNLVPPEKHPMLSWDLSFVLFPPQFDRFEPIESIPLWNLSLRLLALLALGSGGRIGVLPEFSSLTFKKSGGVFVYNGTLCIELDGTQLTLGSSFTIHPPRLEAREHLESEVLPAESS